jgi:hypothetical protein
VHRVIFISQNNFSVLIQVAAPLILLSACTLQFNLRNAHMECNILHKNRTGRPYPLHKFLIQLEPLLLLIAFF